MANILIADDEKEIIDLLKLYLERDGTVIFEAANGKQSLEVLEKEAIDLIILDIMMPELNGFEVTKKIREQSSIPIMIISAKIDTTDKIFGLELGADDYITKPFDPLEVTARVRAALRRNYELNQQQRQPEQIVVRELTLDMGQCLLIRQGEEIPLTSVEFKVLFLLMNSPGQVFTKEQIFEAGWEDSYVVDDNTIRVCISKLRNKVGEHNIKTIRGLGYRLEK
ncbi:response regulator transcription factor [Enterococcus sp. LJL51]|uniref:response regulator transcription factor n=1 Tax=Enterococcus sp. LJL51 TaxID=3416656 RepID=UPI003CEB2ED5